jgi:arsenate reductase
MAEGLVNHRYSRSLCASSAGTHPSVVHPLAIKAMTEIGIDISRQTSKGLSEFEGQTFDYVVMVCSDEAETCPFFPGGKEQIHHSFENPAAVEGSEAEKMNAFRKARDEIDRWVVENFIRESEPFLPSFT